MRPSLSSVVTQTTAKPTNVSTTATSSTTQQLASNVMKTQLTLTPAMGITTDVYMIRTRTANMRTTLPKCQLLAGDVVISGCMYRNGELIVGVKKKNGNMNPGSVRIKATSRTAEITFDIALAWQSKVAVKPSLPNSTKPATTLPSVVSSNTTVSSPVIVDSLLAQRRANFPITIPKAITKISMPLSASEAPALMKRDMSVLLHNASMLSSSWMFVCSGTCSMSDSSFATITVTSSGGMLKVLKNGLSWNETSLSLSTTENSTIAVLDAVSKKQYGIYRGKISVQQQAIKKIDGNYTNAFAVINTLPMEKYLAGMAEASDKEPMEKTKVLALLTKAYALYYV